MPAGLPRLSVTTHAIVWTPLLSVVDVEARQAERGIDAGILGGREQRRQIGAAVPETRDEAGDGAVDQDLHRAASGRIGAAQTARQHPTEVADDAADRRHPGRAYRWRRTARSRTVVAGDRLGPERRRMPVAVFRDRVQAEGAVAEIGQEHCVSIR